MRCPRQTLPFWKGILKLDWSSSGLKLPTCKKEKLWRFTLRHWREVLTKSYSCVQRWMVKWCFRWIAQTRNFFRVIFGTTISGSTCLTSFHEIVRLTQNQRNAQQMQFYFSDPQCQCLIDPSKTAVNKMRDVIKSVKPKKECIITFETTRWKDTIAFK